MTTETANHDCPRCNGTGRLQAFTHVLSGVCFKCAGAGKVTYKSKPKAVKPMTAYETKLLAVVKTGDMASYTYRQLFALRDFAHWPLAQEPNLYAIWRERGEPFFQAAQEGERLRKS